MLSIKLSDIVRATLTKQSGNEGWIGVSPRGDEYHVVVPVDVQIARGVMACNRPTDGTPFGGYAGWLYFRCPQYEGQGVDDEALREEKARETGARLISWLALFQIEARLDTRPTGGRAQPGTSEDGLRGPSPSRGKKTSHAEHAPRRERITCSGCGKSWSGPARLIGDAGTKWEGYRACSEDFRLGRYVFSHECGAQVEVAVTRFARLRRGGRSLVGSHACPGLCYYETSLRGCSAACEGAVYRRIARRLGSRGKQRKV
ncbi:MAG: hypothetical protein RDU20_05785 [Desulfomonilaceae bacterium]|nr:hypothetical protein [Desulfomonilaceae bacterium]